ncbi:hypothetical protein Tco_1511809, partial [Tanacetum coccineum]
MHGPYVRRMIPEPVKQIEADDQAIQTILIDLPEDIYAAVDSCVQNVRNQNGLIVVLGIANQNANQNGNSNFVAARAEGDLDEIEDVNANYILMANLQQASTSGTQTDKYPVYDSDGSAEVQQNDSNAISTVSSVEQSVGIVEQHPATVEKTHAYFESLYNNLAIEVGK